MYYFCNQRDNLSCIFVNALHNVADLPREVLGIQDFSQGFTTGQRGILIFKACSQTS